MIRFGCKRCGNTVELADDVPRERAVYLMRASALQHPPENGHHWWSEQVDREESPNLTLF